MHLNPLKTFFAISLPQTSIVSTQSSFPYLLSNISVKIHQNLSGYGQQPYFRDVAMVYGDQYTAIPVTIQNQMDVY